MNSFYRSISQPTLLHHLIVEFNFPVFLLPLIFLFKINVAFEMGSTFRKFRWLGICPFFHARRVRERPQTKITHVKVGCINYGERHLSPMACRLDERKKRKFIPCWGASYSGACFRQKARYIHAIFLWAISTSVQVSTPIWVLHTGCL